MVLERKYSWNCLIITIFFLHLSPTSSQLSFATAIHGLWLMNIIVNSGLEGLMLGQRHRRWSSINPPLIECSVLIETGSDALSQFTYLLTVVIKKHTRYLISCAQRICD